ncbi:tRNA lysidine(34) synthetase TilS [Lapidilactobacillus wuchangensis]|uniref:tRNA lysidine(34) synthetase TilS n=1 Tax=Lapidilactobacillus wuchangensis TaxID=2486001 RepID=UPI000F7A7AF5|nr:tRNA lysidine(34) synthetase TilS [Lapidilactobacillus wuchangensis]
MLRITVEKTFLTSWQQLPVKLTAKTKILVAFSGGADSTALVALLQSLPVALRPEITLGYFNHQLRRDSADEEKLVRQLAKQWQLPLKVGTWAAGSKPTEAAARQARYQFLATVMQQTQNQFLVTAHHGDDLLETIILRLIRSGATTELPGLKPVTNWRQWQILRPLLPLAKNSLLAYVQQQRLPFCEDYTNHQDLTLRNRLRHQVVPQLKQENQQVLAHSQRFADELTALQEIAQRQFLALQADLQVKWDQAELQGQLNSELQQLSAAAQQLFWQALWQQYFPELPTLKVTQLQSLVQLTRTTAGEQQLDLLGGWQFVRHYQQFAFRQRLNTPNAPLQAASEPVALSLNQWQSYQHWQIGVFSALPDNVADYQVTELQLATWPRQLLLRPAALTDRLTLANGQHQTLRRRLINQKVPQERRLSLFVLEADKKVVWIANIYNYKLSNLGETAKIIYVLTKYTAS